MGGILSLRNLVIIVLVISLLLNAGCVEKYVDKKIAWDSDSSDSITGDAVLDGNGEEGNASEEQDSKCQIGYKECGKACIEEDACCSKSDCSRGETCENFECISLKPDYCPYRMVWDVDLEDCACEEDTRWCEDQLKCIADMKCCSKFDCRGRSAEYCSPSYVSLRICVENGGKSCKYISEVKDQKNFYVDGENILVSFDGYFEDGIVDLSINGESFYKVKKAQRIHFGNLTIFFDDFKELGGICQDYD
jgi:hypothetical protein